MLGNCFITDVDVLNPQNFGCGFYINFLGHISDRVGGIYKDIREITSIKKTELIMENIIAYYRLSVGKYLRLLNFSTE